MDAKEEYEEEITVTSAMVSAGVAAFDRYQESYDCFSLVREIYIAMALEASDESHRDQGPG